MPTVHRAETTMWRMFHLNEETLEKLVSGSATASDVQRIRRHVGDCRACARRLEEWRDNFAEVDEVFPELTLMDEPSTTVTPGGLVVIPSSVPGRRFALDFASALWIMALLMALLVGYGASRLRSSNGGLSALDAGEGSMTRSPVVRDSVRMTLSADTPSSAPVPIRPPAQPEPRPAQTATVAADTATRDNPTVRTTEKPPARPPVPAASRAQPAPTPPPPANEELAISPNFRSVRVSEAARRLGGRIRLLNGLEPDHIELGPSAAVPGAQAGLDVVRVVYRTPDGGSILLDQQLIPADSSGFRPIDDPTLETGQTAYGTAPNGVSVATWLDEEGYRMSLVVLAPVDSLRKLVQRVQ